MNKLNHILLIAIIMAVTSLSAIAGSVTGLTTFTGGTPALASEVNTNFAAVKSAVDDNHNRLSSVETNKQSRVTGACTAGTSITSINANGTVSCSAVTTTVTRVISLPANALAINPASTIISLQPGGLRWRATFTDGATLAIKAPSDYAGGPVKFSILFQTTTAASGVVVFFLRPTSLNSGDGSFGEGSVVATGVSVAGTLGFGTVYQQDATISENRLSKGWWQTVIQRGGAGETYSDDVVVWAVALEYQATH